ncbi:DNA helicase [Philodulcilactobacillus myokoensis]|uniref:DNA 3'-5' helicase n=1 Tax=Philodulcilactobacillus myokoensis TaxID=2929573 RepID=A0A9W6B127_9LACO|nr:3'-5' exonuclease [Philodulcilactobacillus myokoensis]GLB46184.1 DNA helicase [Philodulcilactobacillus myokoensis]
MNDERKLPKMIGEQCRILYLPDDDNQVVLGVAGSGKSVEAIYRALWISISNPKDKIVVLTYNRKVNDTIDTYINNYKNNDDINEYNNIKVKTIFSYCYYLINHYSAKPNSILYGLKHKLNNELKYPLRAIKSSKDDEIISKAVQIVKDQFPDASLWQKNDYINFIKNEIGWMQDNRIGYYRGARKYYIHVSRIGRGSERISSQQRETMYSIYKHYYFIRTLKYYKLFNFKDIYRLIPDLDIPENDKPKYIIIDEVQDVSPSMFNALNYIIRNDGRWSVFGDLAQNIFGQQISWQSLGLNNIKKQYRLKKNYRNSREIGLLAKSILRNKYFDDNNHKFIQPIPSDKKGECPRIISEDEALSSSEGVINKINNWLKNETSIAIITMNTYVMYQVKNILNDYYKNKIPDNIKILTINKVKGLEFDNVVLYGIDTPQMYGNGYYDRPEIISDEHNLADRTLIEDKMSDDDKAIIAKRIYVSITRARKGLLLVYKRNSLDFLFSNLINILRDSGD